MTGDINAIDWSKIKVISFDLDDTLWDNSGIIERCQKALLSFLTKQHPPVKNHFTVDSMERIAHQLQQQKDPVFENMTVLRKAVIRQMLQETQGDLSLINPAFAIFYHWRNQIQIPAITIEVLQHLKKKYTLVATSNGNSNLYKIGLDKYFDRHLIAGIDGRAKPSPEMLNKLLDDYQIAIDELVHIGDSHETDIMSATSAMVASLHFNTRQIDQLLSI